MSVSFDDLSSFSFSGAFLLGVNAAYTAGSSLTPDHAEEMEKCIAVFDQAPILYTLNRSFTTSDIESPNSIIDVMSTIAQTAKDPGFSQQAAALLQALAIKGYPLAQWEYARYLEKHDHHSNHARIYYTLLKYNEMAPKYMAKKIPVGMILETPSFEKDKETPRPELTSPMEEAWQKSEHQRWWDAARMGAVTGVRTPTEFMLGKGTPEAIPYIPELMLGTYNLPLTKCVEDQYLLNIYKTKEDRDAFYKTVTQYKLPRMSWADRIAVPVVGWLGKLGFAKDFISEGHKMCAVADVILALLGKEIYKTTGKRVSIGRPALALDTIKTMAKNGFPNAQVFLANYLRQQGLKQSNTQKISQARTYAEKVLDNPYATSTETRWSKRLRAELSQEETKLMAQNFDRRVQATRQKLQEKAAQKLASSFNKKSAIKTSEKRKITDNSR